MQLSIQLSDRIADLEKNQEANEAEQLKLMSRVELLGPLALQLESASLETVA